MLQRPPQRRRDRARAGADFHHPPVRVVPHHHPARVARQPLRRSRGNVRAVLQHRLPGLGRVRQDRGVHVDHHLIAFPRGPGIELVMQRGLRQQGQRVRLLLRPGRGLRRPGRWPGRRPRSPGAAGTASRGPRRGLAGAARRPPGSGARGARRCRPHPGGRAGRGPRAAAWPAARPPVGPGGASPGRCSPRGPPCRRAPPEQAHLGLRGRDAGQGADLGVGELAARQGVSQGRQRPEGAGHPDMLAGGAQGEADAPGEPLGAGAEAVGPAAAGVELADQRRAGGPSRPRGGRRARRSRHPGDRAPRYGAGVRLPDDGNVRRVRGNMASLPSC